MSNTKLPSVVAIDLGAESCRVSLLEWSGQTSRIELVHRFSNAPVRRGESLFWQFDRILAELEIGLIRCGEKTSSPIASIGVDGWAVDYVRSNCEGLPFGLPYCYRDPRSEATLEAMQRRCPAEALFRLSGVQPLRINTLYQLLADEAAGVPSTSPWTNLPEYVLTKLGGRRVAEYTNATHTGLVDARRHGWSKEIFALSGLKMHAAPEMVSTGTDIGCLHRAYSHLPAFRQTRLIATACHDTASAVAAIPLDGEDWAYISSGTWSLVGTLLDSCITTVAAQAAGFTNLGAAADRICFHKNVNGMWLLRQVLEHLCCDGKLWPMAELLKACELAAAPKYLLDVDDPSLLLPGAMASRINAQRAAQGVSMIEESCESVPAFASLIFHSLAARYAEALRSAQRISGKQFRRLAIVGGGSLNHLLNRLTADATGLEVFCGVAESSTIGNFAIQLATLEDSPNSRVRIAHWARVLTALHES